jgi:hypothetical protein
MALDFKKVLEKEVEEVVLVEQIVVDVHLAVALQLRRRQTPQKYICGSRTQQAV